MSEEIKEAFESFLKALACKLFTHNVFHRDRSHIPTHFYYFLDRLR